MTFNVPEDWEPDDDDDHVPTLDLDEIASYYNEAEEKLMGFRRRFGKEDRALIRRGALRRVVEFLRDEMLWTMDLNDDDYLDREEIEEWFNKILGEVPMPEESADDPC
jgi:hypothetical protein